MKNRLYPLKFHAIYKEKIWGSQRLREVLHKDLPPRVKIGESWEITHRPADTSLIRNGPLKDLSLSVLMEREGECLLGSRVSPFQGRFPLLFKYVDAGEILSLQVHPDNDLAQELGEEDPGKAEAWIVLDAQPDASIYVGLQPGTTTEDLAQGLKEGNAEKLLKRWPVRAGEVYYLPAGTVHALGAGVLVAEIQQNSDLTYRLFDWNRVGLDGKPRALHIEKGLKALRRSREEGGRKDPVPVFSSSFPRERLVECRFFHMERLMLKGGAQEETAGERFHLLAVLDGEGEIISSGEVKTVSFQKGETILIPAGLRAYSVSSPSGCTLAKIWIP